MQVNSMQDYVTQRKRRILAATFYSTPPPQNGKTNDVYLSTVANSATQRQRFILPSPGAPGTAPGGVTYSSFCSTCASSAANIPGIFTVVNVKDIHNTRQYPMSVHNGIVG